MQNVLAQLKGTRPLRSLFGDADEGASDSQRRQKLQDDQATANRKRAQDAATTPGQQQQLNIDVGGKQWFRISAGHGVTHGDDDIVLKIDLRTGLTKAQLQKVVEVAMEKGWKEIYVYNAKGERDLELAKAISGVIQEMGVSDKIHCCTKPEKMCANFDEMKRAARDPAALAVLAAAAATAAVAAQQLVPQ